MDRRGSLEWNLETIGKLIIAVAILAIITYLVYSIGTLFLGQTDRIAGERTFTMLNERIALTQKGEIGGAEASVIIDVPPGHMIVSFDTLARQPDGVFVQGKWFGLNDVTIPRPKQCGDGACLCLIDGTAGTPERRGNTTYATVKARDCVKYPVSVVSTIGHFAFDYRYAIDFDYDVAPFGAIFAEGGSHYPVVYAGRPLVVHITVTDTYIELDPRPRTGDASIEKPCGIVYMNVSGTYQIKGDTYCAEVQNPVCVGGANTFHFLCEPLAPGTCLQTIYRTREEVEAVVAQLDTRPPACRT